MFAGNLMKVLWKLVAVEYFGHRYPFDDNFSKVTEVKPGSEVLTFKTTDHDIPPHQPQVSLFTLCKHKTDPQVPPLGMQYS